MHTPLNKEGRIFSLSYKESSAMGLALSVNIISSLGGTASLVTNVYLYLQNREFKVIRVSLLLENLLFLEYLAACSCASSSSLF